jgi:hypothetical protein
MAALAQNQFALSVASGVVANYVTKLMDTIRGAIGEARHDITEIRRMVDGITQAPNIASASIEHVRVRSNGRLEVVTRVDIKSSHSSGEGFVLNRRTKVVHASNCPSVVQIETRNKEEVTDTDARLDEYKRHQGCFPGQ